MNSKEGLGTTDKMMDKMGGMAGLASASMTSGSTTQFVENARIGDLYEIEAAEIALRRSQRPQLQQLAWTILEDHRTSSHHLKSALRSNETAGEDLEVPDRLDTRRQTMVDHLEKASDDEFEKTWLDQQMMAHQETMTLFQGYAQKGDNPQLASFARGTLTSLAEHHAMVAALRT